jgi:hypothetical protein
MRGQSLVTRSQNSKDLAAAAGRRIRYLDQDTEIGDKAEYGIVLLER